MIALGEESGNLDVCMSSLADYYEKEDAIAGSIRDAVTYPFIMIAMMAAVIVVLVSRVMPIFERKYSVHIVVTVPFCYQNPDRQTCHRPVPELVPPHQTFL